MHGKMATPSIGGKYWCWTMPGDRELTSGGEMAHLDERSSLTLEFLSHIQSGACDIGGFLYTFASLLQTVIFI